MGGTSVSPGQMTMVANACIIRRTISRTRDTASRCEMSPTVHLTKFLWEH